MSDYHRRGIRDRHPEDGGRAMTGIGKGLISLGVIAAIVVVGFFVLFERVDATEECVVKVNGREVGRVGPGLRYKSPWTQYNCYTVVQRTMELVEGDPAASNSKADYVDWAIKARTIDGIDEWSMLTMQYHIDREFVDELYPAYPDDEAVKEQLVKSRLRSIVPEVLGRTTATEQYKGALSENSETIREELQRQLDPFGVRVDYFALKRSVFDESFETAIRARAGETEAAEKKKLEQTTAHNEAERQRIQAEGDANARRIAADVAAYETVKKAESDSQAETLRLEARAIQLTKHPELLEFERIQTIRDAGAIYLPDNALPIYQVPQQEKP